MSNSNTASSADAIAQNGLILCSQSRLSREGLRRILDTGDLTVVGDASSLGDAYSMLASADGTVRLVIYENSGGIGDDRGTLAMMSHEFPDTAVVVLTDCMNQEDLNAAITAGARGYLPRDISPAALRISLDLVLLGEPIVPMSGALKTLPYEMPRPVQQPSELRTPLSEREGQILVCLEEGLANKVIARDLQMAEATVKVHVKAIMRKIRVDNRTQAAVWSMNNRRTSSLAAGAAG